MAMVGPGYRTDKFAVGDEVTWAEKYRDTARSLFENGWSEGPFTIKTITDREYEPPRGEEFGQSNWQSMGHTQHVTIKQLPDFGTFSGAFFVKVNQNKSAARRMRRKLLRKGHFSA